MLAPLPGGIQKKAQERVGTTGLDQLRWFLDLLNRLPQTAGELTENGRQELEADVASFCESRVGAVAGGRAALLTSGAVVPLLRDVREKIQNALHGYTAEIQMPSIIFGIPKNFRPFYMGLPEQLFPWAIAKLIETEGYRIRVCARRGCANLFARRKRGKFCSVKCAQLVHFARYVARHKG